MKIALLSFLYEPELGGGAAVVVNQLAQSLVHKSHSVVVITTWSGKSVRVDYIDGIKIIRIPPMNIYWVADKDRQANLKKIAWQLVDIWNPMVYRLVRQILVTENVDFVHSHKLRGLSPSIWSASSSIDVKKIIHTCHDYELLSPEGFFMGKVGKLAQEQKFIMRPYQKLRRNFSKLVNYVTAPSQYVMDQHQRMGFFPSSIMKIIPNSHGFDITELQQKAIEVSKTPKRNCARNFLYLGRLDKAKGIDLLCGAFLKTSKNNRDLVLRIAGWGPLDQSLQAKYRHQSNIIFTGAVFGPEKSTLFRNSDILVAPSVIPEPFGIVIIEAYANGVPVITSRTGAFPEIVREGETGFLVNPESVDDLDSVMRKVSEKNNFLNTMSENCLEEAKKYTIENLTDNFLNIYTHKD